MSPAPTTTTSLSAGSGSRASHGAAVPAAGAGQATMRRRSAGSTASSPPRVIAAVSAVQTNRSPVSRDPSSSVTATAASRVSPTAGSGKTTVRTVSTGSVSSRPSTSICTDASSIRSSAPVTGPPEARSIVTVRRGSSASVHGDATTSIAMLRTARTTRRRNLVRHDAPASAIDQRSSAPAASRLK
ncbi:MAG: hypothetical protein EBS51_12575 [Planctomycetia bacterium]|nr:hypothetical protein [Planctomycetia bacterium]